MKVTVLYTRIYVSYVYTYVYGGVGRYTVVRMPNSIYARDFARIGSGVVKKGCSPYTV